MGAVANSAQSNSSPVRGPIGTGPVPANGIPPKRAAGVELITEASKMALYHTIIDKKNEAIANLAQELGRTETRLRQTEKALAWTKKMNREHMSALDELRFVTLDALSPIEEAINALAGYGIEIQGLRAAHADLRSAAE